MTPPPAPAAMERDRGRPPPLPEEWAVRGRVLSLARPLVMGIVNVTPDSFSDGGRYFGTELAVQHAAALVQQGADLLDVGGESTRPGATPVPAEEELGRVVPVVERLRQEVDVPVSVDTRHAVVARAALDAGAHIVNDVSALRDPDMAGAVAVAGAGLVLMHMRGTPQTMQDDPRYDDVAREVIDELRGPLEAAERAGVPPERVVVDPGIGFAKSFAHNLELMGRLDELAVLGRPILLGPSRKGFLGKIMGGAPAGERAVATASACVMGLLSGARIFRVHDVRVVREALDVAEAIRAARPADR